MRVRSSSTKNLFKHIAGISAMMLCAASPVFAAPPNTEFLPEYKVETLTPVSQAALAWKNVAPNALASYYTYLPLTTADATLAGFPVSATVTAQNPHGAICGRDAAHGGTDVTSTADCYIISARQVEQPMSLDFLRNPLINITGFSGPGLIGPDGVTPLFDTATLTGKTTTAYGYGSGGALWKPYGIAGPTLAQGCAPTAFQNTPISAFTVNTFGDPAAKGIWHWPAPSVKATKNRPVLVQWLNEIPNNEPVNFDPSGDCGSTTSSCYPFNRIVTHVHGAHVGPESDGLALAWYTPNFALVGEGAFPTAAYPMSTNVNSPPVPIYYYPNTQEAATVWYHDHAVGTTHNNVAMGIAGFFPLTDDTEKCLQGTTTPACAGGHAKILPTGDAFELGLAFQDRTFDVNGKQVMPSAAVYDKTDPNCVFDANNNALPGTCKRLDWMKQLGNPAALAGQDPNPTVHLIPYNAATLAAWKVGTAAQQADYLRNFPAGCQVNLTNTFEGIAGVDPVSGARVPFTQCAPFPATSNTLEYFGNMPVVNGVTYAVLDVDPTVYRMRLLGGTDSRTWIAQLVKQGAAPSMMNCGGGFAPAGCAVYDATAIVPVFQIGSEQGLLTNMVQRSEVDLMPGERIDLLVDFSGLGGTTVTMKNLADDAPYSGRFDFDTIANRQPTSLLIPEIMKFRIRPVATPTPVTSGVPAPVNGAALKGVYPTVTPVRTRTIALIEITDQYGRTMPTIDGRGYTPPGIRTTEVIPLNQHERWDIVNTTVDAHPMHLHQVAFQAIDRQAIAVGVNGNALASGFMAGAKYTFGADVFPYNETVAARQASVFSESQYLVAPGSTPIPVAAYEAGLKDTIQCPPGYVTRVKTFFDIVGDYVWHCHILSHEEHDMMRPFRVTSTAALTAPASVTVGAEVNGSATVTVLPAQTAPIQHVVQYRKVGAPFWNTNAASTNVQAVSLVADGTGIYEFRAQFVEPAIQSVHANTAPDSAFTAGSGTVNYVPITPAAGTTLTGTSQLFSWASNPSATLYQLWVGTTAPGSTNIGYFPNAAAAATSVTVTNLPANGSPVYVRLYALVGGVWTFTDYTYTAYTTPLPATMVSPAITTIAGGKQNFSWTSTGATSYQLWIGTAGAGSSNIGIFPNPATNATSFNITGGLPTTGTINARLWSLINGAWVSNDYSYTATP